MSSHTADASTLGSQAALSQTEQQYRSLAENIPVQIWTALPNGHLNFVTEQTASRLGLTAVELLRDGWQNVVHPEDLGLAIERWTRALSTGEDYEVEFRLKLSSGEYAWHLARAVAQRAGDGHIVGWLGTNTNIDEQREERRRIQALLTAVAEQAQEQTALLTTLRAQSSADKRRIAELEAELAKR
jgi:PAS domain S-box-containing protein